MTIVPSAMPGSTNVGAAQHPAGVAETTALNFGEGFRTGCASATSALGTTTRRTGDIALAGHPRYQVPIATGMHDHPRRA